MTRYNPRMIFPLTPRVSLLACAFLAVAALAAALVSQYVFGLHPCQLCLYQRWPYVAIAAVAVLACLCLRTARAVRATLVLIAALFLLDAGIASYHAGVEWGYFEGLEECSAGELPLGATLEEVRRQLMEAPVVSCKDVMFRVLGISMAGWNALYALGGCALALGLRRRIT